MSSQFTITAATASEVLPALVASVYMAGNQTPNSNVHWNSVLASFTTLTGLDMDAFGADKRGYPRLKTAISGAWGTAKNLGWATQSPRRTYCLSAMGGERAAMLVSRFGGESATAQNETVETVVPEAATTPTVVVIEPKGTVGVSWVAPSGTPAETAPAYDNDSYFRGLVASQTRCFGKWSARASACAECPLAALCHGSQVSALSEIGSTLDTEWAARVAAPTPTEPTPIEPTEEAVAAPTLPEGAKVMPVAFETLCKGCGGVCEADSEGVHIPGTGVFHMGCVPSN